MARRRRSRSRRLVLLLMLVLVAGLAWSYWRETWPFGPSGAPSQTPRSLAESGQPDQSREAGPFARLAAEVTNEAADGRDPTAAPQSSESGQSESPAAESALEAVRRQVEEGLQARSHGDLLAARRLLARAVGVGLPEAEESVVRAALVDIARQTIFSPARFEGDTLTEIHVVQSGEVLARIAKSYSITADLLAMINGIPDKNRIGLGQRLKVVHGPFHAAILKKRHQCRVFLDDVLVLEFPVGLGEYGSTPTGVWVASDKLTNPTYYPPASRGGNIIAADDPKNPLGEYWIGLKGVAGEAVGQMGYGIHGTIEPETVGTDVSMGCVRLLSEDIALLYKLLTPGESKIVVE